MNLKFSSKVIKKWNKKLSELETPKFYANKEPFRTKPFTKFPIKKRLYQAKRGSTKIEGKATLRKRCTRCL